MIRRRWFGAAFAVALCVAPAQARAQSVPPWRRPDLDSMVAATLGDSDDAVAQYQLAMAFWDQKKYDQADSLLRRAVRLAPEYADANLALGVLPLNRGDRYLTDLPHRISKDSLSAFVRAMQTSIRNAFLFDPTVDLRILGRLGDDLIPAYFFHPWWEGTLRKGVKQLVSGKYPEAFETLDQALHAKQMQEGGVLPNTFVWYYGLAALHTQRFDRAIAAFHELANRATQAEQSAPSWVPPFGRGDDQYFYATSLLLFGSPERADSAFRVALDLDLSLYMAHVQLARIAEARGDWAASAQERWRAINTNPDDGGLYVDLGGTLLHAGRSDSAEAAFVDATRIAPSDPRAWYLLGVTAQGNGDAAVARAALVRFLSVAPARYADEAVDARGRLTHLPADSR